MIIYYIHHINYYGSMNITNSIFTNLVYGDSYSSILYLNTASFINLIEYGLIFINDDFDVIIDECLFEYNTNLFASIECDSYSYCNVIIKNIVFLRWITIMTVNIIT